jgi:hypothetical protein
MMRNSNDQKDFGFLSFFGMAGNARLVLVFIALIVVIVSGVSRINLSRYIKKINTALYPINTVKESLLYVRALDEFVGYAPYGEIFIYDLKEGKDRRLTFDKYYDASPTYSKHFKTIFFESKRGKDTDYELMSARSDLYGYDIESGEVKHSRELVAFGLEYDDSEILSPIISVHNDSLIAFFEKRYSVQNLIVCNYLDEKVLVRVPIDPHTRTYIDSFLRDYVSVYDASRSTSKSLGTRFVSLNSGSDVLDIPGHFKSKYYFTGIGEGNNYFAVSRKKYPNIGIYSYEIPSGELTLINEIQTSVFGETISDFTVEVVLSKDELIFYSYSDDFGEKLYTLNKESLKPLISSNFEIIDIEFR